MHAQLSPALRQPVFFPPNQLQADRDALVELGRWPVISPGALAISRAYTVTPTFFQGPLGKRWWKQHGDCAVAVSAAFAPPLREPVFVMHGHQ